MTFCYATYLDSVLRDLHKMARINKRDLHQQQGIVRKQKQNLLLLRDVYNYMDYFTITAKMFKKEIFDVHLRSYKMSKTKLTMFHIQQSSCNRKIKHYNKSIREHKQDRNILNHIRELACNNS